MSSVVKEIKDLLRDNYVNYDPKKWKNVKTMEHFIKKWGNEHGGYISPQELKDIKKQSGKYKDSTMYPKMIKVKIRGEEYDAIHIPGIISNSKRDQSKYIKTANDLIMKNFGDKEEIYVDLYYNYGGKDNVMAAALSPIFNLSSTPKLTYSKGKNKVRADLVRTKLGCYKTISGHEVCGTRSKLKNLKTIHVIMGETYSAGEMIAIAFKTLSSEMNVKFHGHRTGGLTTSIVYFKLSDGGEIEFPGGYIMDGDGNTYKKGVTLR